MKAALKAHLHVSDQLLSFMSVPERKSTVRQYESVWKKFYKFLSDNKALDAQIGISHVLDFLYHEFNKGCQCATIEVYKCALIKPLKLAFELDISSFLMSIFMQKL